MDLERVQKSALKVILKDKYQGYKSALKNLNIESLHDRRESICFKFAKKSLKLTHFKKMFPVQKPVHCMKKRYDNKFIINSAKTERYMRSSIPSMQRMLNDYEKKLKNALNNVVPVNVSNDFCSRSSLVEKF